ncbi:phosphatase PAP2 family protein [Streptomyces pyxinae]|uniref:phosphatase PAP2 family protein n=1 Tax=Streptomyces pyxinae TaxID=2970734 RepID=UPI002867E505|nr:phosphatase PAP2 family protein [Streptomyces sp. LP05-1]
MLTALALFAVITWQVMTHGPAARLDERVSAALAGRGPSWLTELGADLGSVPVALPVLAAALVHAVRRGRRRAALYAALAMALVPALVVPLKALTARPGPLTDAIGYFPSGHTMTALVAYGCAAALTHRRLLPVAALLTAATGACLVLRGYHWPLDVLGSLCLGTAVLVVAARPPAAGRPNGPNGPDGPDRHRRRWADRRRCPGEPGRQSITGAPGRVTGRRPRARRAPAAPGH